MKKTLIVTAMIIAALQSFSQTDPLREKLDSIFQYVDKTQIPTGYLKVYGAELMPLVQAGSSIMALCVGLRPCVECRVHC